MLLVVVHGGVWADDYDEESYTCTKIFWINVVCVHAALSHNRDGELICAKCPSPKCKQRTNDFSNLPGNSPA